MGTILGISHVCGSSFNLPTAEKILVNFGYHKRFQEDRLGVPREKAAFLRHVGHRQDMAFYQCTSGLSVEALCHGNSGSNPRGPYEVIVGLPQDAGVAISRDQDEVVNLVSRALNVQLYKLFYPNSGLIFYGNDDFPKGVQFLILRSNKIDETESFWTNGMGFSKKAQITENDCQLKILTFKAISSSWSANLILIDSNAHKQEKTYIDDKGWTCLSVLVTDIDSVLANLQANGSLEQGARFRFSANKRNLNLCFLRGADREIIELIEAKSL